MAWWAAVALGVVAQQAAVIDLGSGRFPEPGEVAHSHNDYEQPAPLTQALQAGFVSVEADIWSRRGELVVSHDPFTVRGRLVDLYLRPLQARVDALGSVYGDGRLFYLWIDLKESSRRLTNELHAELARWPMLTRYTERGVIHGAVSVILTGDEGAKRRYVEEHTVRYACRDSNELGPDDGPSDGLFSWYALPWGRIVDEGLLRWNRPAAIRRLASSVERIHRLGRRIRLYEVPEDAESWSAAIAAGVDLVSTDHIQAFRAYLDERGRLTAAVSSLR
jgi:hypothetical protein